LRLGRLAPHGRRRMRARPRRLATVRLQRRRPPGSRRSDPPPQVMKIRLDRLLVDRGLAESREKAQALIMAGEVLLNRQKAAKPGQAVSADASVEVLARPPYVSRGGLKLAAALRQFSIDVAGQV